MLRASVVRAVMMVMSRVPVPVIAAIVRGRRIIRLRRLRCRGHGRRHYHGLRRRHSRQQQKNSCGQQKLGYTFHLESPARVSTTRIIET